MLQNLILTSLPEDFEREHYRLDQDKISSIVFVEWASYPQYAHQNHQFCGPVIERVADPASHCLPLLESVQKNVFAGRCHSRYKTLSNAQDHEPLAIFVQRMRA